jgi:hypothetical protein
VLLGLRSNRHAFACKDCRHRLGGPCAFGRIIDRSERLQRHRLHGVIRQRSAEVVPVAAHGKRRCPDRTAEVEGKDASTGVAPKLQGQEREQHALAGAGRANHKGMPDIADMERQPERRRPFRFRKQERRTVEMFISFRSGPHRRERHHVSKIEGRHRRLADIGVHMSRQAAQPGLDGVHGLGDAGEIPALDHLLDQSEPFVGNACVLVPHRYGRSNVHLADEVGAEFLERCVGIERLVMGVGIEEG